jgi:hypothetical protein
LNPQKIGPLSVGSFEVNKATGMKAMQTSLALESLAHGSEKCRTRKEFSVAIG